MYASQLLRIMCAMVLSCLADNILLKISTTSRSYGLSAPLSLIILVPGKRKSWLIIHMRDCLEWITCGGITHPKSGGSPHKIQYISTVPLENLTNTGCDIFVPCSSEHLIAFIPCVVISYGPLYYSSSTAKRSFSDVREYIPLRLTILLHILKQLDE